MRLSLDTGCALIQQVRWKYWRRFGQLRSLARSQVSHRRRLFTRTFWRQATLDGSRQQSLSTMTTSLDVSRKLDQVSVDLLLAVDSVAVSLDVSYCIVGAFARDVVLGLCFGIDTGEATRDIDFGLMMDDWAQFDELRARLMANK